MRKEDALAWLEELAARNIRYIPRGEKMETVSSITGRTRTLKTTTGGYYDVADAQRWVTDATSALSEIFPLGHAVRARWQDTVIDPGKGQPRHVVNDDVIQTAKSIVASARDLVRDGRLTSYVDAIRAETLAEFLDQAEQLLSFGDIGKIAATVLAGGALETHLVQLTQKYVATPQAANISGYDAGFARARNDGKPVPYDKADSKQVIAWAGLRNDAAHDPTNFKRSAEEVRSMIANIRSFIARVH